jgi:hypothetical protein
VNAERILKSFLNIGDEKFISIQIFGVFNSFTLFLTFLNILNSFFASKKQTFIEKQFKIELLQIKKDGIKPIKENKTSKKYNLPGTIIPND